MDSIPHDNDAAYEWAMRNSPIVHSMMRAGSTDRQIIGALIRAYHGLIEENVDLHLRRRRLTKPVKSE
jgi:hypothetical protein